MLSQTLILSKSPLDIMHRALFPPSTFQLGQLYMTTMAHSLREETSKVH